MKSFEENLALGRERLDDGDHAGALAHADAALALNPDSFDALQLRSRALYMLGRDTEALQTLRRAHAIRHKVASLGQQPDDLLDDFPLPEAPVEEYVPPGLDALETLLALRERHRLDADLLTLLAELAEDAGRFPIAREAFQELVQGDTGNLDAWEGLLHVTCHLDLDAALEVARQALDHHIGHAIFYEYLGFIHSRRHQIRQALSAYRQAIEYGADHPDNYEAMVQCYLALEETDTALEITHKLIEQNPNDVEAQHFAMEVGLHCGDFDMALKHAHQLVRLEPSHAETYCSKARVEIEKDDWDAAERTLRLGFHKAVDGIFALFDLVDELIADGNLEPALRVAELACQLNTDHPESHSARAKVLREMGELDGAYQAFARAAALAPQDDAYQTWLGVVQDNQGEYHQAIRQFNRVLARHPNDVWTLSNRGLSHLALGFHERALADFNRCIELDPEDAPFYFWRACAQVQLQAYDAAFSDLRRAVDLSDEVLPWLDQEPTLEPIRRDPRFKALYKPE